MSRYLAWIDTPLNNQIEMVEHLKYAGVVVPVERDYEKAYRARSPHYGLRREDVRRIVDAALGIGEDSTP